ncbi:hypothetical protein LP52_15540 [Streptomonospora alba]|uniref:Uncharacterized protein n=1 Tax=Streptomonospora alba TaxID=183763 RepID=A0A0C2J9E0_9ACTN|nr:hypothetical protein LP52_15540 [Streptomonospora alba]
MRLLKVLNRMRLGTGFDPVTGKVPVPTERTVAELLLPTSTPNILAAAGAAHAEAIAAHTSPAPRRARQRAPNASTAADAALQRPCRARRPER